MNRVKVEIVERVEDAAPEILEETRLSESSGEENVAIKLRDGSIYGFSKQDPRSRLWLRLLKRHVDAGDRIYIEADESARVVELFSPEARYVKAIRRSNTDERLRVLFLLSPSIYYLSPTHPNFASLRLRLEEAADSGEPVLVTLHPQTNEVIDVRESTGRPFELESAEGATSEDADTPSDNEGLLELISPEIDMQTATETFKSLRDQKQIPFGFLSDCCYARAHEMCRLMHLDGIQARKIWNFGHGFMNDRATLRFDSPLGPSGSFKWLYHVAPIVQVRQDGQSFKLVMDPGVTKLRPLQVSEWLGFQNDNSSTHRFTAAGIYGLDIKTNQVVSDFGFTRTPAELNKHFDKLEYIEVVNAQLLKSPILNSIEPPIISTEENRKNERT